jgi:hypothetical protein
MSSSDQRNLITTTAMVTIGCIVAWYLLIERQGQKPPAKPVVQQPSGELRIKPKENLPPEVVATEEPMNRPLPPPSVLLPAKVAALRPVQTPQPQVAVAEPEFPEDELVELPPPEPVIPLQVARFALGFVGADPQAEEVWYQAINDPNMPPNARQDLIEDLNEVGFADPRNLTEDDLPLILRRIALIEEVGPDAADEVNARAFAEAYKDLVNMAIRLQPPPEVFVPN